MTDKLRFAYGKRKDGKGWDVLVMRDGAVEVFGPYRLQREARQAICLGAFNAPREVVEG